MDKIYDAPGVYYTGIKDLSNYTDTVDGSAQFIQFVSEKGPSNQLKKITSLSDLTSLYGTPSISKFGKFGQGLMNAYKYVEAGGTLYGMRVLPENQTVQNSYINLLQLSSQKSKEDVINASYISEYKDEDVVSAQLGLTKVIKGKFFLTASGKYILIFEDNKAIVLNEILPANTTEKELLDKYILASENVAFTYETLQDQSVVVVDGISYTLSGNSLNINALIDGVNINEPLISLRPKEYKGKYYNNLSILFSEIEKEDSMVTMNIYEKSGAQLSLKESFKISFDPDMKDAGGESLFICDVLNNYSSLISADYNYTLTYEKGVQLFKDYMKNIMITIQDGVVRNISQLPIEKVNDKYVTTFDTDAKEIYITDDFVNNQSFKELYDALKIENPLLPAITDFTSKMITLEKVTTQIPDPNSSDLNFNLYKLDDGTYVQPVNSTGVQSLGALGNVTITGNAKPESNITINIVSTGTQPAEFSGNTLTIYLDSASSYGATDIQTIIRAVADAPVGLTMNEFSVTSENATTETGQNWVSTFTLANGVQEEHSTVKYMIFFERDGVKKLSVSDTLFAQTISQLPALFTSEINTYSVALPDSATFVNDETNLTSPTFVFDNITYYFREDLTIQTYTETSTAMIDEIDQISHTIKIEELPSYKMVELSSNFVYPLVGTVEYSYDAGLYQITSEGKLRKFDPFGFQAEYVGYMDLKNGSDGEIINVSTGKIDPAVATSLLVSAYNGLLDANSSEDFRVSDKLGTYFTKVFDANYPIQVKDQIVNLVDNIRDDCVAILDMGLSSSISESEALRKTSMTYNSKNVLIYDNSYKTYNEFDKTYNYVTPTYALSSIYANLHSGVSPWEVPAGLTNGGVSGISQLKYKVPDMASLEKLSSNQINTILQNDGGYYLWGVRTSYKSPSVLQQANAVFIEKYVYRAINTYAKSYIFKYNTSETWDDVNQKITQFLAQVRLLKGITSYSTEVSATEYEIKNRTFHIYVELTIPGIVEKITFSIGVK